MADELNDLKRQLKQAELDLKDAKSENTDKDLIGNLQDEILSLQRQIKKFKPVSHDARQFEILSDDGEDVHAIVTK